MVITRSSHRIEITLEARLGIGHYYLIRFLLMVWICSLRGTEVCRLILRRCYRGPQRLGRGILLTFSQFDYCACHGLLDARDFKVRSSVYRSVVFLVQLEILLRLGCILRAVRVTTKTGFCTWCISLILVRIRQVWT